LRQWTTKGARKRYPFYNCTPKNSTHKPAITGQRLQTCTL
jgi:hypothetical protein